MGGVEELTGADLRFTPEETGHLLRLESGEPVDPVQAASVQSAVGGWPAAIRLIGLSGAANEPIQQRASTDDGHTLLLRDYLGEEVMAGLPPCQHDLLLRASMVDRFDASLLAVLSAVNRAMAKTGLQPSVPAAGARRVA